MKTTGLHKFPALKTLRINLIFLFFCGLFTISVPIYMNWLQTPEKSLLPFSFGILGSVLMWGGALFYVLRKRVKAFRGLGKMKAWLDIHIILCLIGPMLIIYHSEFSVRAPNSAVAYYAMLIMVFSGFIGRYFYKNFQISLSGKRATLKEMKTESDALEAAITSRCAEASEVIDTIKQCFLPRGKGQSLGLLRSVGYMVKLDWIERKLWLKLSAYLPVQADARSKRNDWDRLVFQEILKKRIQLEKKIALLEMTTKLFSYWHALHVPLVFVLLLTFVVHVVAVLVF